MKPPIKKLAIVFLLCAIVTSSLALGTSLFINYSSESKSAAKNKGLGKNAFVESRGIQDRFSGGGANGENMTDDLISIFAQGLVEANPEGPKLENGVIVGLEAPSPVAIDLYLSNTPPSSTIITPPLDESKLQVLDEPTQSDVSRYFSFVTQIQEKVASDPSWHNLVATTSESVAWADQSRNVLVSASEEIHSAKVPAPLLEFHRPLLKFYGTLSSFSQIAAADPMAAAALSDKLTIVLNDQTNELEKAKDGLANSLPAILSTLPPGDDRPIVAKILGIQLARATVPTIDYVHIATTIANFAKEFAIAFKEIALATLVSYLKDKLLAKLQDKVIDWARGLGAPGYVTDWLVMRIKTATNATSRLIDKKVQEICGNAATKGLYGAVIASALGSPSAQSGADTTGDPPGCPYLEEEPPDLDDIPSRDELVFGWNDFLNSMVHNPWNDLLSIGEQAVAAGTQAVDAKIDEAIAGDGFLDTKKCDEGSGSDNGDCEPGVFSQIVTLGTNKKDAVAGNLNSLVDDLASIQNANMLAAMAVKFLVSPFLLKIESNRGVMESTTPTAGNPPPAPGGDLRQQLTAYSKALNNVLTNTDIAMTNLESSIGTLNNALQVCTGAAETAEIQGQIEQINEFRDVLNSIKVNVEDLLDEVEELEQAPGRHTVEELHQLVGTPTYVQGLEADSIKNRTDSQALQEGAGRFILSCSST